MFGFADLLQWMELNQRSGRLTFVRARDRRIVDWRNGEIVYVSGSLPRHRLGVHLLRGGALPAAILYDLLARNFTSDMTLTRLILDFGHDTHDGLSLRVEELARKLLFEMFEWDDAEFVYDPDYQVQPILRIGLSLKGQSLAFHAAKKLDDSYRRRPGRSKTQEIDPWNEPFGNEEIDEHYWEFLERAGPPVEPEEGRRLFAALHRFAQNVHELGSRSTMHPVHQDTAVLLGELLKRSPVDPAGVIPIAALDPYLTLDLLILANSLSVDRDNAVGTVPDAIERLGARAVTVLIDRLSSPDYRRIADSDAPARLLRRASVAAAVAAGKYAERYGVTRERGYTLGLLHTISYADLFEVLKSLDFPAGAFRAAAMDAYRPILGSHRAEGWSLPLDFQAVIADDGTDPSAAASLVRTARAAMPACAIGSARADAVDPYWIEEIAAEVRMVFEFLGLGPVEKIKSV